MVMGGSPGRKKPFTAVDYVENQPGSAKRPAAVVPKSISALIDSAGVPRG
jgi:hypothetical protein